MLKRIVGAALFSLMVLGAKLGLGAGGGERMPAAEYVEELLANLPAATERLEPCSPVRQAVAAGELEKAYKMLSFRPLAEAPIPKGFPSFTPVGVIEVKTYPAYRKAEGPGFWPLFQHIQARSIPMTAPVEMTADNRSPRSDMAFLYQSTQVGSTGKVENGVAVVDAAETTVASLGVRGRMTPQTAGEAKASLVAWLKQQEKFERVGEGDASFRYFGYNSPMVADRNKYWEAQLLLKRRTVQPAADALQQQAE